jgi:demethylmenaquinone methyltransferase/2-methoxy-6-polyprenyl-1,4-benzoquinol methylase
MGRFRRIYYDIFSGVYDLIIRLHSRDDGASLRDFLVESSGLAQGDTHLDICTGTGSVALRASRAVSEQGGKVIAVDFSGGMLRNARRKILNGGFSNIHLVKADVSALPFKDGIFDVVTCSHAMYELPSATRLKSLDEIRKVLKPGGTFVMMEHEIPARPLVRFLYYVRLFTMGSSENRHFARDEAPELGEYFSRVTKRLSPTGKSKLLSCVKSKDPDTAQPAE